MDFTFQPPFLAGLSGYVAELGAAFLCGDLGITAEPRPDHAAYIDNWLRILKSDRKAIFTAAGFSSLMTPLITRPSFMVKRLSW